MINMWRPKYRIRENIISQFNWAKNEIPKPAIKTFIVERRLCWFWWWRESKNIYGLQDEFDNYSDAVFYVKKRAGKLIYIC